MDHRPYLEYVLITLLLCLTIGCSSAVDTPSLAALDVDVPQVTKADMASPSSSVEIGTQGQTDAATRVDAVGFDASIGTIGSSDAFEVRIHSHLVELNQTVDLGSFNQYQRTQIQVEIVNLGTVGLTVTGISSPGLSALEPLVPMTEIAPGQSGAIAYELSTDRAHLALRLPLSFEVNGRVIHVFRCTVDVVIHPYIRDDAQANPAFRRALDTILRESGLVGLAAAVVRGTEIVAVEGVGLADREQAIAVDPRLTRFRWASVAKSMGAVVALRADEIDIDASITEYLSGYEVPNTYLPTGCTRLQCAESMALEERQITLRQLLSHRGGIQHYTNGVNNPTPPASAVNDPAVNDGIEWAIDYFVSNPLIAKPGTAYAYSSFGYNLMGVVLEHALGETYANLVQRHVGDPLGMQTLEADRFWAPIPNRAVGYRFASGRAIRDSDTDVSWKLPGGGFISTVVELARYCGGLQSDVLLSAPIREGVLWHDHFQQNYALGFGVGTSSGRRLISHTGSQQKAASSLRLYPDEGLCIVVMSNTRPDSSRVGFDSAGAIGRQVDAAWREL